MTEFSLATPMTLEAITAGTIVVKDPQSGMKYSKNGAVATTEGIASITVDAGDKVAFYGNGTSISSYNGTEISGTAQVKVYGNTMSLLDETGFETKTTLSANQTFRFLFYRNISLIDARGLLLPAPTLREDCYQGMFSGCNLLTTAPKLPATTLSMRGYNNMFYNCSSLTTAPELPVTTLSNSCYMNMFRGCSNLTTAYVKAAYTESESECSSMFRGCTAAGAVLHTTTGSEDSWSSAISSNGWSTWTAVGDWN